MIEMPDIPTASPVKLSEIHLHKHSELRPLIFRGGRLYKIDEYFAKPRGVHLEIFPTTEVPLEKAGNYRYKLWLGGGVRDHQKEIFLPIGTSTHAFRTPEEAEKHAAKALGWFLTRSPYDVMEPPSVVGTYLPFLLPKAKPRTAAQMQIHRKW